MTSDAPPDALPAPAVRSLADAQHSTLERIDHAFRLALDAPLRRGAPRGAWGAIASGFLAWRESRFAARVCREMLRLHAQAAADHPELLGPSLYRRIVATRHDGNTVLADGILDRASRSFADWPASRALRFRDVVHYLVVVEFIASRHEARWIHVDLKRLVNKNIPVEL